MIGMKYLFWNTHKNIDINPILRDLITENCISIVVLAEYTADINDLIRLLYDSGVIMEHIPTVGCDRIHILGRIDFHIEPQLQTDYASIQVIGRDNSRNEVEDLIVKILTSKKVLRVMQELIRIHQAKSSNNIPDSLHDGTSNAE